MLMPRQIGMPPEGFSIHLFCGSRVDESAHGGDAIGWKAYALGVFLDDRFVWSEVDAVHFVTCHIAMEPLNLRTQSL